MSPPEWLVVGARVVELSPDRWSEGGHIVETNVEKIGKRDVVLANGNRYNVNRLRKSRGTWDGCTELLHVDDDEVKRVRRANRRINLYRKARDACEAFTKSKAGDEGREAITAIREYLNALDADLTGGVS